MKLTRDQFVTDFVISTCTCMYVCVCVCVGEVGLHMCVHASCMHVCACTCVGSIYNKHQSCVVARRKLSLPLCSNIVLPGLYMYIACRLVHIRTYMYVFMTILLYLMDV